MRRLLTLVITGLGIAFLVVGALTGGFARILYFSSQICLSCMGLV